MKKVSIPLRKDCRVDNVRSNGLNYYMLVDFINNVVIYTSYSNSSPYTIGKLYSEFKFAVDGEMQIDNWNYPFYSLPFKRIEGINYSYPFATN